jgi:predicted Zn-dependent protease
MTTVSRAAIGDACGPLAPGFGPFDYLVEKGPNLEIVETHHLRPSVRLLETDRGKAPGFDLDYTLRAFPNHHIALQLTVDLAAKEKTTKPLGMKISVECYFDRAIRFSPKDAVVRVLHGNYLTKSGHIQEALSEYKEAEKLEPDNASILYNMGIIYFKQKDYEQSRAYAKKAYARGFPLPGLKKMLIRAGKWD